MDMIAAVEKTARLETIDAYLAASMNGLWGREVKEFVVVTSRTLLLQMGAPVPPRKDA